MENDRKRDVAPLAVRMRPRTLDEVVGQAEAVGEGSWLRAAIENDTLSSVILFGPAGTGKTSLAHVIAESTRATFVEVSAIGGTVSDLRREIDAAEKRLVMGGLRTILFVDEIHRFNRSQQDALLHAVEDRLVVLVGATTENPFFEVNSALISRSRIVELHSLSDDEIAEVVSAWTGIPVQKMMQGDVVSSKRGSGIGVKNVNDRIRLYFGEAYGVQIISAPDEGTTARIYFPMRRQEDETEK